MFSFMNRNSSFTKESDKTEKIDVSNETTANPVSATDAGSLFGGMNVNAADSLRDNSDETSSAFSFMTQSEPQDVSGFQFLMADNAEESQTSFSFMASKDSEVMANNFDVASSNGEHSSHQNKSTFATDSRSGTVTLSKASSGKPVKKKKRSSRVGFAREDEDDLVSEVGPADIAVVQPSLPIIVESEDIVDEDEKESHSSRISNITNDDSEVAESTTEIEIAVSAFDFLSISSADEVELSPVSSNSNVIINETGKDNTGSYLNSNKQIDQLFNTTAVVEDSKPSVSHPVPLSVPAVIAAPQNASENRIVVQQLTTPKANSVKKMELINDLVVELTKLQNCSIAKHTEIRSEIETTNRASVDLRARLSGLELEQSRLAQEEEFESAEAMNVVIDTARADIDANAEHIRLLTVSAVDLSESFSVNRKSLLSQIAVAQSELATVKDALEAELAVNNASDTQSRTRGDDLEEARLRAEQERISLEKSHFEREEEALANELHVTEEAIRTQSGDYQATRESVEVSLLSVQSEIKRLELQLLAKRQEESELLLDLTQVEGKIGEVRKKYERQLQRIHDRSQALAATKYECLEEERTLAAEHEVFSSRIREMMQARAVLARWTIGVSNNLSTLIAFMDDIQKNDDSLASQQRTILTLVSAISSCDSTDSQHSDLQHSLDESYVSLLNAQNVLEGLETQMTALTTESRSISEQIPKLEVEKKTHASNKRFKEAALVAKDIKDFLARREQIDLEVASVGAAIDERATVVTACRDAHDIAADKLKEAHRQQDIARFEALVVLSRQLRRNLRVIAKAKASDPAFADGDLEPFSSLYASMERLVNDELSSVLAEAHIIKQEHSLPQLLEEEEEEEEERVEISELEVTHNEKEEDAQYCSDSGVVVEEDTILSANDTNNPSDDLQQSDVPLTEIADSHDGDVDVEKENDVEMDAESIRNTLKDRLQRLSAELATAEDNEDYERAAELFEEINGVEEEMTQLMDTLKESTHDINVATLESNAE